MPRFRGTVRATVRRRGVDAMMDHVLSIIEVVGKDRNLQFDSMVNLFFGGI